MAHAVRQVWLEPEEQIDALTPQLTPRRKRSPGVAFWQHPTLGILLVVGIVTGILIYTYGKARVDQCEIRRQQLQQELVALNRECVALRLESERLNAQPRMTDLARAKGLELPTADRVHYVRVTDPVSPAVLAQQPGAVRDAHWAARSGRQLVASLDAALQRLGRVPGEPAYAQE